MIEDILKKEQIYLFLEKIRYLIKKS